MGHAKLVDSMIEDGLWDAFNDYHMGITAENLAEKYGLTREEQDAFAAASQQKAIAAIEGGRFRDEITPIQVPQRKGEPLSFDTDEQPRAAPPSRPWPSSSRPSGRTAASPPATPPASTTAPPRYC